MTVRRIRQSEIRKFMRCKRSWNWSYRLGLDKDTDEEPTTANIGTIVHAALEEFYAHGQSPVVTVQCLRRDDEACNGPLSKKWADTYELAEIMVEGYIDWLAETGKDADYRTVQVERRLEVPFAEILGDEIIVTGQLDLLAEHTPTGLVYLRDHKTVATLEQTPQLQIDPQMLTYAVLLKMAGTDIAGAEHNQLRRVKRTATAKPPFYARPQVQFNEHQLRNHYRHLHGTLTEIVRAYQTLDIDPDAHHDICPPTPTQTCGWECSAPGLSICVMEDDGSDVQLAMRDLFVTREPV